VIPRSGTATNFRGVPKALEAADPGRPLLFELPRRLEPCAAMPLLRGCLTHAAGALSAGAATVLIVLPNVRAKPTAEAGGVSPG
jgi:hypothetical protein